MPAEAKRHCSPSRIYDLVMRYNPIPRVRVFYSGSDFDDSLSWLGRGLMPAPRGFQRYLATAKLRGCYVSG